MGVSSVCCVLVLACVGLARGRSIVELPDNSLVERTCPHEAVPNSRYTVPYILLSAQYECYRPGPVLLAQINGAASTDEYRRVFRAACVQAPQVKTCIADVATDADVCLSSLERKMFKTVRDFVEASVDAVCADGSETAARMYGEELRALDFSGQIRVLGCVSAVATQTEYKPSGDLPGYTMRRYQAMQRGRQCIVGVARSKGKQAREFSTFIDGLLGDMECIHPDTKQVVTCHSIDTDEDEHADDALDGVGAAK